MGQNEVKQFNEMLEKMQKDINILNYELTQLQILSLGIIFTPASTKQQQPQSFFQVYRTNSHLPGTELGIYLNKENAEKKVKEWLDIWPEAHYVEIGFDD